MSDQGSRQLTIQRQLAGWLFATQVAGLLALTIFSLAA